MLFLLYGRFNMSNIVSDMNTLYNYNFDTSSVLVRSLLSAGLSHCTQNIYLFRCRLLLLLLLIFPPPSSHRYTKYILYHAMKHLYGYGLCTGIPWLNTCTYNIDISIRTHLLSTHVKSRHYCIAKSKATAEPAYFIIRLFFFFFLPFIIQNINLFYFIGIRELCGNYVSKNEIDSTFIIRSLFKYIFILSIFSPLAHETGEMHICNCKLG